ncbi:MAG: hypothetical protein CVU17_08975 [Betaproteobacteria bacterium HGW-Betaproteobacteria-11]|nr:MAG: hypothetical protein CVU17_08975 [Betaproteobacteria bacterium HGW-Betaproteobacteria-11]
MRIILVVLLSCLPPSAALAQNSGGFTNMLRSLSGALGAGKDTPPPAETAPIGIRGIDDAPAAKAAPSPAGSNDIGRLEGWAASRGEAERMAARHGLVARPVVFAEAGSEVVKPEAGK